MAKVKASEFDLALAAKMGEEFYYDPYGWVMFSYPWGEPGSPLANSDGPDTWQKEQLQLIGRELPNAEVALRIAVSSGNGSGKSALMAWIIEYWMSTRPYCKGICTAGTKTQLATKLWPELALWHDRLIYNHWFSWQATSIKSAMVEAPDTWACFAVPWNSNSPDSFAGTHSTAGVLGVFDEGSTIDDVIWDTFEGALTETGSLWCTFGNPVRSSGRFYEAFTSPHTKWHARTVNTENCKMVNKAQIKEWADTYGRDSDFFRAKVLGEFPSVSTLQFIPTHLVNEAMNNHHATPNEREPLVIGVDVAREGNDHTVVTIRRGGYVFPQLKWQIPDTMVTAEKVARIIDEWDADTVFVDAVGNGAGVVDRLRQLGYRQIIEVKGQGSPDERNRYINRRAQMWGNMLEWLKTDVHLPNNEDLRRELVGQEYGYAKRTQEAIQLANKPDMKKLLGCSPDHADSLAMTFAFPTRPARLENMNPRGGKVARTSNSWRCM